MMMMKLSYCKRSFISNPLRHRSWIRCRVDVAIDRQPTRTTTTMAQLRHVSSVFWNHPLQTQPPPPQQHPKLQYRWISKDTSSDDPHKQEEEQQSPPPEGEKFVLQEPGLKSTKDDEVYDEEIEYAFNKEKVAQRIDRSKFTVPVAVKMPDLNGQYATSKIQKWYASPGDIILYQTVLADIETPDFTFGLEADHEDVGILSEILVSEHVDVPVGSPICIVLHQPEDDPDYDPDLEPIDDYSDEALAKRRERIAKKNAARKQGRDFEE
jgi:hypothetical protein